MEKITDDIYRFRAGECNAYLIKGETNILIDGVMEEYADKYIREVSGAARFRDIKYIVINHAEPNRSGTLDAVLKENPDITVIASTAGLKFLGELTERNFKSMLAKDGMELYVNGAAMKFTYIPYINWPDSMVTLYKNTLFSCDLLDGRSAFSEKHFYAAIETVKKLEYENIFPGSGDLIEKNSASAAFCAKSSRDTVLILYSSAYGATRKMAETVLKAAGHIKTEMYSIDEIDEDAAAEKINECRALILGVNTINADAPKKLWGIIGKTDKLLNKQKPCMLFGAYAWSGEGLYYIEHHLKMLRYKIFNKPFSVILKMKNDDEERLIKYASDFIGSLGEK